MVAMTIDRTVDLPEVESERLDDVQPQTGPSEDRTWERFAACAGMPEATQLFFSDDLHDVSQAKLICAGCPVMANCLEERWTATSSGVCGAASCSPTARWCSTSAAGDGPPSTSARRTSCR